MKTTPQPITGPPAFPAILSGILLTAAFPKIGLPWVAWVALVPLLLAISRCTAWQSFRVGLLVGCIHFLTLLYWLADTMRTYGQLPWYVSIPVLFLFALYLSLYIAGFCCLISRFSAFPMIQALLAPVFWVAFEFVRANFLSGFPWEMLGYSQFLFLRIIQISDIFGVYGVSFLLVFGNACVFLLWQAVAPVSRPKQSVLKSQAAGAITLFAAILISVLIYGEKRITELDRSIPMAPSSEIAVIQGNISQALKWDPTFLLTTTEKYSTLSLSAVQENPALIIWPETATPFYFLNESRYTPQVIRMVREIGKDFVIGSPAVEKGNNGVSYRNRAYLVTSEGTVAGHYDKSCLVPFGEYVPLKKWFPFIGKIVAEVGDFEPGPEGKTLEWRTNQLGMQICYEMIFPSLSRKMTLNGADCIVNITNDAWYGTSSAPYQLFSMAIFRAVENRRSVIRAANTGISGFVDPVGRIMGYTELFTDSTMTRKTPLMTEISIYTRYGDLFSLLCLTITGIIIIRESAAAVKNRKTSAKKG